MNEQGKRKYEPVKRALDVLAAAVLLLVCALPLLLAAALVFCTDGGPVFFSQERIGRDGVPFQMYKLRTLKRSSGHSVPSKEMDIKAASTKVGWFFRKSSIDELPQLWNVLRGDMSLVGPRPLIRQEGEIHALRMRLGVYAVRPGMTGLAQINGRDELEDDKKAALDAQYVRTMSLKNDLIILLKTVPAALRG